MSDLQKEIRNFLLELDTALGAYEVEDDHEYFAKWIKSLLFKLEPTTPCL